MTVTPPRENGVVRALCDQPRTWPIPRGGTDMPKGTPGRAPCSIDGCENTSLARGWCAHHYDHWRNHGHPTALTPREKKARRLAEADERFWAKVQVPDDRLGCWLWTGAKARGYGVVRRVGTLMPAHRLSYELCLGPIPHGLYIDHICRNPACVNPIHLDPVTNAENVRRGSIATTTHCRKGHRYAMPIKVTREGVKRCPECERENNRTARDKRLRGRSA